jgi:hypothetical protein
MTLAVTPCKTSRRRWAVSEVSSGGVVEPPPDVSFSQAPTSPHKSSAAAPCFQDHAPQRIIAAPSQASAKPP